MSKTPHPATWAQYVKALKVSASLFALTAAAIQTAGVQSAAAQAAVAQTTTPRANRGESTSPTVGSAAPPFRLQDQSGAWHTLADYRGRWLVIYFYPKDNTPHCTTEACAFRDNIFAFDRIGAKVVGISVDDVDTHRQFAADNQLPFTLLSDADKSVAKRYGVLRRALGIMEVASRETFLVDPQGRIAKHYADVEAETHSQQVLTDLKALQAATH